MREPLVSYQELLPHLFRLEYAKMTAVLYRHFGLDHMETAEDIVSETFLKATEVWPVKGIPANPEAWLYTVAKNKTKDYLKRLNIYDTRVKSALNAGEAYPRQEFEFNEQTITDSQLAMIFVVCNPANSEDAQICLALQVLCGFSIEEIADAFLMPKETIKKRLFRARATLRKHGVQVRVPGDTAIQARLGTVLRTLYLLFNEGYYSKSGNQLIRKDLCAEAIRLTLLLCGPTLTNQPETNALLALMCYQSSRLEARTDNAGQTILFEQQDKTMWDRELIDRGNYYMLAACTGKEASKYHLEAGIAYWHTLQNDTDKWQHILQLYDQLLVMEYSPVTAMNRAFAFARVYGKEQGIREAEKLGFETSTDYHALLGYLYTGVHTPAATQHYQQAIRLCKSLSGQHTLQQAMAALAENYP